MTTFNQIDMPDTITVTSRGQSVDIDTAALPADIIIAAAIHGITQKVADGAAGALRAALPESMSDATLADAKAWGESNPDRVNETAVALMSKVADTLQSGEWSQRATGGGGGVTPEVAMQRRVVRELLKKAGNEKAQAEYKKLDGSNATAYLDAIAQKFDAIQTEAARRVALENEKRKATAKLSDAINF